MALGGRGLGMVAAAAIALVATCAHAAPAPDRERVPSRSGVAARPRSAASPIAIALPSTSAAFASMSTPPPMAVDAARPGLPPRFWHSTWRRVGPTGYGMAAFVGLDLGIEALVTQPRRPPTHFVAPLPGDEAVRSLLRTGDSTTFHTSSDASWVLMIGLLVWPEVVDLPVALARGGRRLAWELFWEDALTLGTATVIDLAMRDVVGRARPWYSDCLTVGHTTGIVGTCGSDIEDNRSFPGGHFAVSTAAATLLCEQHLHTRLYGGAGDALLCGSALAADATVGVLRIVMDEHWTSDILAGGVLGSAVGVIVPMLVHYRVPLFRAGDHAGAIVAPTAIPLDHGAGLALTGVTF